eukprot:GEZU01012715.1.p1 GENE.GEZU01012715.1~~GEZU01012715.1.p1  ORF type:complete len:244 (-),score=48.82 GEZU01012715.1:607-1338(-)
MSGTTAVTKLFRRSLSINNNSPANILRAGQAIWSARGYGRSGNEKGPIREMPDWSFADGTPAPLTKRQRLYKLREQRKLVTMARLARSVDEMARRRVLPSIPSIKRMRKQDVSFYWDTVAKLENNEQFDDASASIVNKELLQWYNKIPLQQPTNADQFMKGRIVSPSQQARIQQLQQLQQRQIAETSSSAAEEDEETEISTDEFTYEDDEYHGLPGEDIAAVAARAVAKEQKELKKSSRQSGV